MSYPYKAWKLQPLYKPVEVEIVGHYHGEYEDTATGGSVNKADLFLTKQAAIAAGYKMLDSQQEAVDKRQARINKRRESLKKAENK